MADVTSAVLEFRANIDKIAQDMRNLIRLMAELKSAGDSMQAPTMKPPESALRPESLDVDYSKTDINIAGIEQLKSRIDAQLQQELTKTQQRIQTALAPGSIFATTKKGADTGKQAEQVGIIRAQITELQRLAESSKNLKDVEHAYNRVKAASDNLSKAMTSNRGLMEKNKDTVDALASQHARLKTILQDLNGRRQELNSTITKANKVMRDQQVEQEEFTKRLDIAIFKIIRYRVAFTVLHKTILQLKDTITVFREVDYRLAQIGKVLPAVGTNFDRIRDTAFRMGKQFGVSINEILDSMKTWAQLGLTQTQTLIATEAALLAVNTTGLNAVEVTNALTAAIFAYNIAVEDSIAVVDKFMAVQANFAVTAQDIAKALFATGSAASEMGVSLDQLSGLVVGIGTTTRQTGKEIGNALKTIFARVARPETIKAFQDIGVAVFKSKGEFRSFFDVLGDVAAKWHELDDAQKQSIGQTAAGVRRYVQFIALMNNFALAQSASITAQNSMGAAFRANQLEMQTFQKTVAQLGVIFDEIKFKIGEGLVKPLSVFMTILKNISTGPAAPIFIKLTTILTGLITTFVVLKGVTLGWAFVMRQVHASALPATVTQLKALSVSLATCATATTTATAATVTFGAVLKATLSSMTFWITAISLAIGLFAAFGPATKTFGQSMEFTTKSQLDFIKSLDQTAKLHKEELALFRRLLTERKKLTKELTESTKGTEEYASAKKNVEDKDREIIGTSAKLGAEVAKLNALQASNVEINRQLAVELSRIEQEYQRLIDTSEDLREKQIADFWLTFDEGVKDVTNEIETLQGAVDLLRAELEKETHLTLLEPDVLVGIKDGTTLISALAKQFGLSIASIEKTAKEAGHVFRDSFYDEIRIAAALSLTELKSYADSYKNVLGRIDDPTTKEKVTSQFELIESLIEGARKSIREISVDTDKAEYAERVAEILKQIVSRVRLNILSLTSVTDEELKAAQGRLEGYYNTAEAIRKLDDTGEKPTEYFPDLEAVSVQARNMAKEFALLNYRIDTGKDRLEAYRKIAIDSGAEYEGMAAAMAAFHLGVAQDIEKFYDKLDEQLIGVQSDIEFLRKESEKFAAGQEDYDRIQKQLKTMEELEKVIRAILNDETKLKDKQDANVDSANKWNEAVKESKDSIFKVSNELKTFQSLTKDIVRQMESIGYSEEEVLNIQNERLKQQVNLIAKQAEFVKGSQQEVFLRQQARKLTQEQLKILSDIATVDIARSLRFMEEGAKEFVDALKEGLGSVPDILEESFDKRKELTQDLRDAEDDLTAARLEGDRVAEQTALTKIKNIKAELDDYRAGWVEVKKVIESITTGISDAAFQSIADQFAEAIANIQLGGETLGTEMGKSISHQFDVSSQKLIEKQKEINDILINAQASIYTNFLIELAAILDTPVAKNIRNRLGGETKEVDPIKIDPNNDASKRFNTALRTGAVYFAAVVNRALGQAGGRLGQDIAGALNVVGSMLLPSLAAGPFGPLMTIGTGVLGGLLGKLFAPSEPEKEEPIVESLEKNTDAIQANTLAIKEFNKGIFNAPPRFTLAPYTGNIGGLGANVGPVNIQINVPDNPNLSADDIAQEVINAIESSYSSDISRTRVRGSTFVS